MSLRRRIPWLIAPEAESPSATRGCSWLQPEPSFRVRQVPAPCLRGRQQPENDNKDDSQLSPARGIGRDKAGTQDQHTDQ